MKKALISIFTVAIALVMSCDKVELPNVGTVVVNESCDTVFTFSASTSNSRNVLVEDFTGHLCGNCPEAAYELDQLHDVHGDSLIVLSIHPNTSFNEVQTGTGKYETDWRIEEAEQIFSEFNMPSSLPRLMINREQPTPLWYHFNTNQLAFEVPNRMGQLADFTIKCSGNMLADRTVCAKVEVELLNTVTGSYNIVNCLVEDSITDYQTVYVGSHPDYTGASDDTYSNYIHRHVVRDIFGHYGVIEGGAPLAGSIWGDPIAGSTNAGDIKQFVISSSPMPAEWDENHMYIVSYVFDDLTKEVLQVIQTKIAP
jgi:hypothetical protein